jgi:hypothetical protein
MTENPFDMPLAIEEAAERDVNQARNARELMDAVAKAMGVKSGAPLPADPADFKAVQDRAMDFAADEADAALAFAGKISNAKSLEELWTLQAQFVQHQMQTMAMNEQALFGMSGQTVRQAA